MREVCPNSGFMGSHHHPIGNRRRGLGPWGEFGLRSPSQLESRELIRDPFDTLGESGEDEPDLGGRAMRPGRRGSGEDVEDPTAFGAARVEDRGAAMAAVWTRVRVVTGTTGAVDRDNPASGEASRATGRGPSAGFPAGARSRDGPVLAPGRTDPGPGEGQKSDCGSFFGVGGAAILCYGAVAAAPLAQIGGQEKGRKAMARRIPG